MTGFSREVRQVIKERESYRCARCSAPGVQVHHRRPRGMGGTLRPDTNGAANGLYFCLKCHQTVEENRSWGRVFGYLVPQDVDPALVPVLYLGAWVLLDDEGNVNPSTVDGELEVL